MTHVYGFPVNHPPVQVSKEAKDANSGAHTNMSIKAVVPVIMANNKKRVDDISADLATSNIDNSHNALGNLIFSFV